jgi:predicted O-linked N-acetylglucosamine transferase (SPINDLY family)
MATISQAFALAFQHYRAGRWELAEQICQRIVQAEPAHADAWHLLGVIAHSRGEHAVAVERIGQAIACVPSTAAYHNNLGLALNAMGRRDEAIGAHINLGLALVQRGELAEAEDCYHEALRLAPQAGEAWSNLGDLQRRQGNFEEAVTCCRRAVRYNPRLAEAHHNLGCALRALGHREDALRSYQRAQQLQPDHAEILHHLGTAWKELAQPAEAATCFRRLLAIQPDRVEAWISLGNVLRMQSDYAEALRCYERALELQPDQPGVYNNLANTLNDLGRFDEAIAAFRTALRLNPDYAEAYSNLANVLHRLPELDEAIACYRRAMELNLRLNTVTSNYLCVLRYRSATTPAEYAEALADYERRHAAPLRVLRRKPHNTPDPARPLRLGLVSSRFAHGPVGAFLLRALEHLDRRQFSFVFYANGSPTDEMTARFQALATSWHDVTAWDDERLAEHIRSEQVDLLFDLIGHAPRNRLLAFARKPAPVQITWIDSVGSTGLSAMDYVVGDPYEIPMDLAPSYSERVLRMPETYVCYTPPDDAPPVGPLPAACRGYVTFASFNNPAKITVPVVERWARILQRVAGSRLLLKYNKFDQAFNRRRYGELFARCGVGEDRVEFQGGAPHAEFLHCYNQVDLALDPIYNGGLTTCEALWMGVPVVTCPGDMFPRRHGLSHLSNAGLTETIATDFDAYVELAVQLAQDLPRLAAMRARLREQMASAPLCDGPRFAEHLTANLREVWRRWCETSR